MARVLSLSTLTPLSPFFYTYRTHTADKEEETERVERLSRGVGGKNATWSGARCALENLTGPILSSLPPLSLSLSIFSLFRHCAQRRLCDVWLLASLLCSRDRERERGFEVPPSFATRARRSISMTSKRGGGGKQS